MVVSEPGPDVAAPGKGREKPDRTVKDGALCRPSIRPDVREELFPYWLLIAVTATVEESM
jgi:hypothetical protein